MLCMPCICTVVINIVLNFYSIGIYYFWNIRDCLYIFSGNAWVW
jgi:hypothetical protein